MGPPDAAAGIHAKPPGTQVLPQAHFDVGRVAPQTASCRSFERCPVEKVTPTRFAARHSRRFASAF
jgi:hypothetical protein